MSIGFVQSDEDGPKLCTTNILIQVSYQEI